MNDKCYALFKNENSFTQAEMLMENLIKNVD